MRMRATSEVPNRSPGAVGNGALRPPSEHVLRQNVVEDRATVVVHHRHLVERDDVLPRRLDARRGRVHLIIDVVRVRVVHRDPGLELCPDAPAARAGVERKYDVGRPALAVLGSAARLGHSLALLHPVGRRARVDRIEAKAPFGPTVGAMDVLVVHALVVQSLVLQDVLEEVAVEVDAVGRVSCVLLALEPVARDLGDPDLADRVGPYEHVPRREHRNRLRSEVGVDEAADLPHRVGRHLDLLPEPALDRLERRFEALA